MKRTVIGCNWVQPDAAGNGRGDARVDELQPRILEQALVELHNAFVLTHERDLRVELLAWNRILREQGSIAFEVNARIGKQGLIAHHLPFVLRDLRLVLTRVDLREQLALFDDLAFAKRLLPRPVR